MLSGLLFVVAVPALPPFTVGYSAPIHGQPCTHFAGWESFTLPNGAANAPDDAATTASGAGVWQLAAGGVITAPGNLDNLTIPPVYRVTDSVPADLQEVVLQISANLNPLNWSSFTLGYVDTGGVPHTVSPSTSTYLVHLMGHDERVITWDLSANSDAIFAYQIDFTANNSFATLDAVKLDARFACAPGVPFCSPGAGGVIACPCANPPAGLDRGCDNSAATGGASILAGGAASLAADSLSFTTSGEKPTAATILLQGSTVLPAGIGFGQGVRCIGGSLKRLFLHAASGGSATFPQAGDPTVSAQSLARGDPIAAGQHRYYTAYYRDPIVLGGCPAASGFNVADALDVVWAP
jgi:hypothetical protein